MTTSRSTFDGVVEIRPEVVFLYEVLQELARGSIKIPRFQRAFVWRPDQMTDLLDSINKQYPVGSLLIWETTEDIATLGQLGPFTPHFETRNSVGYLLDGHQRLLTLAGALLPGDEKLVRKRDMDNGRWDMYWNVYRRRFQHGPARDGELLFPLTALLDTMNFFEAVEAVRGSAGSAAREYVNDISALARTFQSYRVPVIRIRETGLSEAVEIFARLNSKGQSMTADQMVSALTFRQGTMDVAFDLSSELDRMVELYGERFGEVDRGTILRAILANLDEDIYKTDWTKLANDRRQDLQSRLQDGVLRTDTSIQLALDFLEGIGVKTSRLLPYGLQLVLLSAFFDRQARPSAAQLDILRRWFWVSSFSAWFGGANPSRTGALIREFRESLAVEQAPVRLSNFDLEAESLPFPLNFDMRSARTRTLLLVMLWMQPRENEEPFTEYAVEHLASRGPSAVGHVFPALPKEMKGHPANRVFRPPSSPRGSLRRWVLERVEKQDFAALESCGIDPAAARAAEANDARAFVLHRQDQLSSRETEFQLLEGVRPSQRPAAEAPVDTE